MIEKRTNFAEKLLHISIMLSAERDLKKFLVTLTRETQALLHCDKATIFLVDKESQTLSFFVTEDESLKKINLELNNDSIAGYSALKNEVLNIEDAYLISPEKPYRFNKEIDKKTGFTSRSILTIPMSNHEGDIIGVFQLINKKDGEKIIPFTTDDEEILRALSSAAGISLENALLYNEREELFASTIKALATAIEARDPATLGHSRRVANYSLITARAMKTFNDNELKELFYAAWMHDVGKIGVREHILTKDKKLLPSQLEAIKNRFLTFEIEKINEIITQKTNKTLEENGFLINRADVENLFDLHKTLHQYLDFIENKNSPGRLTDNDVHELEKIKNTSITFSSSYDNKLLTDEDFERITISRGNLTDLERQNIEKHVIFTFEILKGIPFPSELKNVPKYASLHHEKLDGTGYPFNLKGDQIPLQSRIIAVCDIYDALAATDRPYKKALSVDVSLSIVEDMVNRGQLDKQVYYTFVNDKIYTLEDSEDRDDFKQMYFSHEVFSA